MAIFFCPNPCIRVFFFRVRHTQTNTLFIVICYVNVHTRRHSGIWPYMHLILTKNDIGPFVYRYRYRYFIHIAVRQKRSRTRLIYFVLSLNSHTDFLAQTYFTQNIFRFVSIEWIFFSNLVN